jgi:hypothetical protein
MTFPMLITCMTAISALVACAAPSLTPVLLTYLALRDCKPHQRTAILRELGPALLAARTTFRPNRGAAAGRAHHRAAAPGS